MTDAELIGLAWRFAVGVLILAAWTYVVLEQRKVRRRLDRHRADLNNHARRLTRIQGPTPNATGVGQPMNDKVWSGAMVAVPKVTATISGETSLQRHTRYDSPDLCPDPDPTLRLKRPPALSDIEATIARAGRCLTPTELATELERKPWDLLPELERLTSSGRIKLVPGHTAGQSAYTLADPTVRLSRMPVLPGLVP